MRIHSSAIRVALAVSSLALVTTVVLPATSAVASKGPKVKATPHKGLAPNQLVTLKGSGLVGDSGELLAQCAPGATNVAQCDVSTEVAISVDSKGHLTAPLTFTVVGPSDGLCSTAALHKKVVTCGLGLVNGSAVTSVSSLTFPAYYVSLGDSYSVGYQPVPLPDGAATSGFTGVVAKKEKLTLVNFGCGGATTSSILDPSAVCGVGYGPPAIAGTAGTVPSGESQAQAAEDFMTNHAGQIGLVTVSIGGNDVTPCAAASGTNPVMIGANGPFTDPISCILSGSLPVINGNLATLLPALRSAAGPSTPIVGLTYPDVLLGLWVCTPAPANTCTAGTGASSLAGLSVTAFQSFINPALKTDYTTLVSHGYFVDVTAATGAYVSLTTLKNLAPYSPPKIPAAVAEVCKLTYYCSMGNIHANTKGYALIGKLIAAALS